MRTARSALSTLVVGAVLSAMLATTAALAGCTCARQPPPVTATLGADPKVTTQATAASRTSMLVNSSLKAKQFTLVGVRYALASDGVQWATAVAKARNASISPTVIVLRKAPGKKWVTFEVGQEVNRARLPEAVQKVLWP